jgi:branched-chain amino acid transport system ATP-binding protein
MDGALATHCRLDFHDLRAVLPGRHLGNADQAPQAMSDIGNPSDGIILRTTGVGKVFGKFVALNNISAEFPKGAITSIIGPNGAGKSTYFNLLSGAFPPSSGRVEFEGRDVTGLPQHRFAHMGVAKSFQITNVFPQLTTRENIRVGLQALVSRYDMWRPRARLHELTEQADELLALVGLWESRERAAKTLAHGEQRALEIGMALASRPRLLLLDEPTAGMSPEETRTMMDLIVKLASERTVILVEHKMKLVLGISDRILVLHHGELLAEGTPAEVRKNEAVKRVYLGQREH